MLEQKTFLTTPTFKGFRRFVSGAEGRDIYMYIFYVYIYTYVCMYTYMCVKAIFVKFP